MDHGQSPHGAAGEPARPRWAPKPEQILILESIFNSGMVNPPKEETVRIRRLLERFGAVRDANVFYWFQNRRSRSRRRARQLQQAGLAAHQQGYSPTIAPGQGSAKQGSSSSAGVYGYGSSVAASMASCSVADDAGDDLFAISRQMGFLDGSGQSSSLFSNTGGGHASQLNCQLPGTITVYINDIPYEVPSSGPLDLRSTFGHNVMLVHSSGQILQVNEYGLLINDLKMGECYFAVSTST